MKIIGDKVIFSNGTEKHANCGIIGLSPDMTVSEGYDGGFHQPREDWMTDEESYCLNKEEQIELANYMIAAWKKFKTGAV